MAMMPDENPHLPDHTLEEFVLGRLDPADAARIQARVNADPELARRCRVLREQAEAVRAALGAAAGAPMEEPLDDETLALFLDRALPPAERDAVSARLARDRAARERLTALYRETLAAARGDVESLAPDPSVTEPFASTTPPAGMPSAIPAVPSWVLGVLTGGSGGVALAAVLLPLARAPLWLAAGAIAVGAGAWTLLANRRNARNRGPVWYAVCSYAGGAASGGLVAGALLPGTWGLGLAAATLAALWSCVWALARPPRLARSMGKPSGANAKTREGAAEKSPKTSGRI
jgi:anti-sigma factor RsiW